MTPLARSLSLASAFLLLAGARADADCPVEGLPEDVSSLLQVQHSATEQRLAKKHAQAPAGGNHSHLAANGTLCFDGPPREIEGSLALKKAGIVGALYDNVYARPVTCADQGYLISNGTSPDYPTVSAYFRSSGEAQAYHAMEAEARASFGSQYGLDSETVALMSACSSHRLSQLKLALGHRCDALHHHVGAWMHRNPADGATLLCNEGPFVHATYTLAVLKGTPSLLMHQHDHIAATTCENLGFPHVFYLMDHCFPPMYMWTRMRNPEEDAPVLTAMSIERNLRTDFSSWATDLGLNLDILMGQPKCHCLPGSEVYESEEGCVEGESSPIRDWFTAAYDPTVDGYPDCHPQC